MKSPASIPLAIIGMGCRLPGADNLDEFWKLVVEGRSAIVELPPDRLNQELYYDPKVGTLGKSYSKLGGIINNRDFDRRRCPISPQLEASVDQAHLLMCDVAAAALRDAGLDPFNVPQRNTGVYIGHAQGSTLGGDYTYATYAQEAAEMLREVAELGNMPRAELDKLIAEMTARIRAPLPVRAADSPDVACSLVAGTISKAFGLTGPFLALNSACASSLQAMLVGARALQFGHVDMAMVGGASDCKGDSLVLFAHARAMSSKGSRPFDADADGLIVGEGYVALVMKTLERALADGDPIRAVVRGLGVSSDGKGKSLWAPRKEGQVLAMQRAYREGLDLGDLDYVEAHATATQLGDATELNTLAEVLNDKLPPGKKVPITSVKANVGHTLETAGIAGVIKTVLALTKNTIPPAANVAALNPKIDWDRVPVYVPLKPEVWQPHADGRPRRAGVNAFGIGGLNMHVVIEEFNDASRRLIAPQRAAANGSTHEAEAKAVAVIGMGCVLPGAQDVPNFWQLLESGRDPKCDVPAERWRADLAYSPGEARAFHSPTKRGGFVTDFEYDWQTHKIPPKQVAQADPLQFMLLEASDQALKQAGYDKRPFDRTRVGVVVGTEFGGDFAFQLQMGLRLPEMKVLLEELLARRQFPAAGIAQVQEQFGKVLLKHWPALIDETGSFSTSSLASRTAKTWNLMGGAVAIDSGHGSSLAALSISVDALLAGDVDMMLCAAGQRRLGLPEYEALAINGFLAVDGDPACPLDAGVRGYVPGEGVGVFLLKRLSEARRDGDRVLAIVRGVGGAHDPQAHQAMLAAAQRAAQAASLEQAPIDLVEIDGSIAAEDARRQLTELASWNAPRGGQPAILSTVVAQIGHTEAAAGMASLIKASLEMEHGRVPGTFGLQQPLAIEGGSRPFVVASEPTPLPSMDAPCLAAVASRSRGLTYVALLEHGCEQNPANNASRAVRQPQAATTPVTPVPRLNDLPSMTAATGDSWQVFRLGASTEADLLARVRTLAGGADDPFGSSSAAFAPQDRFRAAIVARDREALRERLRSAAQQGANPAAHAVLRQQGIFLGQRAEPRPRVVFCFPGQGSQYPDMVRALVEQSTAAAQALAEAEAAIARYGYQPFALFAWGEGAGLGSSAWLTQLSMLVANHVTSAGLRALGVEPDAVLGHSFGVYSALCAAGSIDFETAMQLTRARCDGIATSRVVGGLLAAGAAKEQVLEIAAVEKVTVYLANHNAPQQTVVGGAPGELERLQTILKARGIAAKILAVPAPFHTPLMKATTGPLERALETAEIRPARAALWSILDGRPVTEVTDVRRSLVEHLTSPVLYVDLIRNVTADKPCVLVEVGPQQVLTNLNRRIVEDPAVTTIASDQPKRPGMESLIQVQACLEVLGVFDAETRAPAATVTARGTVRHELLTFDATKRRRDRMRQAAQTGKRPSAVAAPRDSAPTTVAARPASAQPERPQPAAPPVAQAPRAVAAPTESKLAAVKPVSAPAPARPGVDLERFLINFVVDQTGYPPEVVELDADLEADLGIDSIKKAQLFGELQEYFDVVPTEELTLDMFPTLRHVLDFLKTVPIKGNLPATGDTAVASTPDLAELPNPAPASVVAAQTSAVSAPGVNLERFLINFVVEQTGYPPEVVELDADLEADLGIDSIKKAQLFGELQEYFDVVPTEELTLDMFPTLRHVLDFLKNVPIKGNLPGTGETAPEATATMVELPADGVIEAAAPSPTVGPSSAADLERFLINFVVEQTGYPPEVVELDADLEADLGIDSIKKAQLFGELQEYFDVVPTEELTLDMFPTLRHVLDFLRSVPTKGNWSPGQDMPLETYVAAEKDDRGQIAMPVGEAMAVAVPPVGDVAELEQFLINFVVEQTGYPPEVVELDADLEADLGIDSIKKAQLFGELQEYFDVVPTEELTLDMFPTLRHVLDFLKTVPRKGGAATPSYAVDLTPRAVAAAQNGHIATNGQPVEDAPAGANAAAPVAGHAAEDRSANVLVELVGTPYEMGRQHGERLRADIRRALRRYADLAGLADAAELPGTASAQDFGDEALDELQGIADGAGVPLASVLIHQRWATADLGGESVQFLAADALGHSHLGAWSLPLAGSLAEVLRPAVFVRRPTFGEPHLVVAIPGTIGGLMGLNTHGVSVAAAPTNSKSTGWWRTIGDTLANAPDAHAAVEQLAQADRSGSYTIGHGGSQTLAHVVNNGRQATVVRDPRTLSIENPAAGKVSSFTLRRVLEEVGNAAGQNNGTRAMQLRAAVGTHSVSTGGSVAVLEAEQAIDAFCVLIDVGTGDLWLKGPGHSFDAPVDFEHFALRDLLPPPAPATTPRTPRVPAASSSTKRAEPPSRPRNSAPLVDDAADDGSENATLRFAMRVLPQPFAADAPQRPQWHGAVFIVGDNPTADRLQAEIAASGTTVHRIRRLEDRAAAELAIDRACEAGPVPHLFLTSERDLPAVPLDSLAGFEQRLQTRVLGPYYLAQRWLMHALQRKCLDRATLVATTALGGDYGFSGSVEEPEGGALAGLVKAICIEFHVLRNLKDLLVKVIDAPHEEPAEQLADNMLRELAWRKIDFEVAFNRGQRYLQNAHPVPISASSNTFAPRGTWVVTGGARGITAECARELAQRYGLRLHLIGRSARRSVPAEWLERDEAGLKEVKAQVMVEAQRAGGKPAEAWNEVNKAIEIEQQLAQFERAGVAYTYHACDVADAKALKKVLDDIRSQDGPIHGILHGAGIEQSTRFERKSPPVVEATLAAKVTGAFNLMHLCRDDPVEFFVSFGSISGRLGGNGQTDYSAASDMLAKLSSWYRSIQPHCRTLCFHWHPWDEVGMAYRPETRAMFQMSDAPERMPKRAALDHFVRELTAEVADAEVLITNRDYFERYYGKGTATPLATADAPVAQQPRVAQRRTLTLRDAPERTRRKKVDLAGTACILGDNADADRLEQLLRRCGTHVQRLSTKGTLEALLAKVDQLWSAEPARHLFLMTSRDREAMRLGNAEECRRRRLRGIEMPYLVAQRWVRALRQLSGDDDSWLVAVTNLGGDFGLSPGKLAPESGALAGLVKSVHVEGVRKSPAPLRLKVIDLPAAAGDEEFARALITELNSTSRDVEVAYRDGQRRVVDVVMAEEVEPAPVELPRGGTWVVTGGARGITAAAARHLGQKYGLKLHLIGASPAPRDDAPWRKATDEQIKQIKQQIVGEAVAAGRSPEDDWMRVRRDREIHASLVEFERAGVKAVYHTCDVGNWDALARTLDDVRREDGPIAGIIHGAGWAKSARLEMKNPGHLARVIGPKFDGTLALASLTRQDPLKYFISFGSISGRWGGNGLSDYAAANDAQAKLAAWFRHERPDCHTACIAWQTWDEIGMATLSDGTGITRNQFKMQFIPVREGVWHLERELLAACPAPEVVITDGFFADTFYGERKQDAADATASFDDRAPAAALPLIASPAPAPEAPQRFAIEFDPAQDPFLIDHRLRDAPFLPGVVGIESLIEGVRAAEPARFVQAVRDVEIVQGIKFQPDRPMTAHVAVEGEGNLRRAALTVEVRNRAGKLVDPARPCCSGTVELGSEAPAPRRDTAGAPALGWLPFQYPDVALMYHGPRFRCLRQCNYQYDGGWGQIVAPEMAELGGPRGGHGWTISLGVLDACVVACGSFVFVQFAGRLEVPHGFARLQFGRAPVPGETCTLRYYYRGSDERHSRFDFTLWGADGAVVFDVDQYQTVLVAERAV
ncbi:MAG: SDR family NAD(P)-dependent oxidoreductase [Pirellulales bacterium]|nr:SDR family NAD(P)-dependent oxidoreductase [Pirellulales bacterium]